MDLLALAKKACGSSLRQRRQKAKVPVAVCVIDIHGKCSYSRIAWEERPSSPSKIAREEGLHIRTGKKCGRLISSHWCNPGQPLYPLSMMF